MFLELILHSIYTGVSVLKEDTLANGGVLCTWYPCWNDTLDGSGVSCLPVGLPWGAIQKLVCSQNESIRGNLKLGSTLELEGKRKKRVDSKVEWHSVQKRHMGQQREPPTSLGHRSI